jgi:hypothetical protein
MHQHDIEEAHSHTDTACPNYEPRALWRLINPLRDAVSVLEINLSDGCHLADKYLVHSSNSSVTRISSVHSIPALLMGWRAHFFSILHVLVRDETDCLYLDGLWSRLQTGGILILQEGRGPTSFHAWTNAFLASHADALAVFETRTHSFVQIRKTREVLAAVPPRRTSSHVYVVALSESSAWDGRWLKYIDFLATALPDTATASLTVERDVLFAPRIIELAFRRHTLKERSVVVVLLGSARSNQLAHLQNLAIRLALSQAPAVGIMHLQSWR